MPLCKHKDPHLSFVCLSPIKINSGKPYFGGETTDCSRTSVQPEGLYHVGTRRDQEIHAVKTRDPTPHVWAVLEPHT